MEQSPSIFGNYTILLLCGSRDNKVYLCPTLITELFMFVLIMFVEASQEAILMPETADLHFVEQNVIVRGPMTNRLTLSSSDLASFDLLYESTWPYIGFCRILSRVGGSSAAHWPVSFFQKNQLKALSLCWQSRGSMIVGLDTWTKSYITSICFWQSQCSLKLISGYAVLTTVLPQLVNPWVMNN